MKFFKLLRGDFLWKSKLISVELRVFFIFFIIFLIYLWMVFPDIYWVDSGEFTFHSIFLGIPHPTGYPTYIQLLKLFSLFPLGSPFYLINFSSALLGFLALLILYKIVLQLTQKIFPALFAVIIFGLSPTFMSKVDTAEVYTFQILILLSVTYLFLIWMNTHDHRKVILISFWLGLGLTNHMTTILLIPIFVIILFIFNHNFKDSLKIIFFSVPFFLLGCLPYLFIYFRNDLPAPMNFAKYFDIDFKTIYGWYWLLSGELFRYEMLPTSILDYIKEVGFFGYLLFKDFYYLPALLGLLGLTGQVRYDRRRFIFLFSLFFFLTSFFIYYRIPDIHDYYTMSFALFAIWIGIGVHRIVEYVRSSNFGGRQYIHLALGLFCLIPLYPVLTEVEPQTRVYSIEYAHKVFATLPANSIFFTTYTGGNTLLLMQRLAAIRPDIVIFDYGLFSLKKRAELAKQVNPKDKLFLNKSLQNLRQKLLPYINAELNKRPVFFSRDETFLFNGFYRAKWDEGIYQITRKEPLITVPQLPTTARRLSLDFDRHLHLLGYEIAPTTLTEGELFAIDFYWRVDRPLTQEFIGLIYFVKEEASFFENSQNFFLEFTPGSELRPPTQWIPGAIIKDPFQFSVRPHLRKGNYWITLSLFEKNYFQNTPFKKIKLNPMPIGRIQINENPLLSHYWDK